MQRSTDKNNILILEDGREVLKNRDELFSKLGVQAFIRFHADEFSGIDKAKKYLAHFNLEQTNHEVGKKYALVKILRPGNYSEVGGTEALPLISLKDMYLVECVDVKNNLPYADITPDFFTYSLPNIQNVEELKTAIYKRYSASMPDLSKEEMESLGVGYTLVKFL